MSLGRGKCNWTSMVVIILIKVAQSSMPRHDQCNAHMICCISITLSILNKFALWLIKELALFGEDGFITNTSAQYCRTKGERASRGEHMILSNMTNITLPTITLRAPPRVCEHQLMSTLMRYTTTLSSLLRQCHRSISHSKVYRHSTHSPLFSCAL